jgi:hypothetical protein
MEGIGCDYSFFYFLEAYMILESVFQAKVIKELEELFPGCIILKNDEQYIQGFPDLLILYKKYWAVLECKRYEGAPYRPNQEYYLELLGKLSYSNTIYPENKEEVLYELQKAFKIRRRSCISRGK